MLNKIKQFFSDQINISDHQQGHQQQLQMASAALLIELSHADFQQDSEEQQAIEAALKKCFGLSDQQLQEIVSLAEQEKKEATSLYQFTRLINDHYSPEQKFELILSLWQVAAADGQISKYEDHLIRKVADLIYVSHSDFIKAKLQIIKSQ